MLGVATVGNPVARALNGRGVAELARLCVRRDVAPLLRWNAASMLLGEAARCAERAGFKIIVTYTREDESGTSLRGAGWTSESRVRPRSWHSAKRPRSNANADIGKIRWSRILRPKLNVPVRPRRAEPATLPDWMQIGGAELGQFPSVPVA